MLSGDGQDDYEMTEKVNEQLKQELAKLGDPMIIAGCPSCMKQLKESLGAKVTGIWEILKEIGLPGQAKGLEIPVAIHDACGARGDTQTQDTIRELSCRYGVHCCKYRIFQRSVSLLRIRRTDCLR